MTLLFAFLLAVCYSPVQRTVISTIGLSSAKLAKCSETIILRYYPTTVEFDRITTDLLLPFFHIQSISRHCLILQLCFVCDVMPLFELPYIIRLPTSE
jgi:hypothetical protein